MKIYFSLKDIPELQGMDIWARNRAWYACIFKTFLHWQNWFSYFMGIAPLVVFFFSVYLLPLDQEKLRADLTPLYLMGFIAFLFAIPGIYLFFTVQVELMRPYLREYLEKKNLTSRCS